MKILKDFKAGRALLAALLIIVAIPLALAGAGCQEKAEPAPEQAPGIALASTLVPDTDFDIYIYVKQENPTPIPPALLGRQSDMAVESLAMWGIPSGDSFTFGGGITLVSAADAETLQGQAAGRGGIWTSLSNNTVYFVEGSGASADALKTAITQGNFKYYDNAEALQEIAMFPDAGTARMAAVAVATPSEALVSLIANRAAPEASGLMDALLKTANIRVAAAGLYAPAQINIAGVAGNDGLEKILATDRGILAEVKSGWPGAVVSPIVVKVLENAGYVKMELGDVTAYKGYLDTGKGGSIPVFLRVEGDRVFAAVSGQESYAEILITSINLPS